MFFHKSGFHLLGDRIHRTRARDRDLPGEAVAALGFILAVASGFVVTASFASETAGERSRRYTTGRCQDVPPRHPLERPFELVASHHVNDTEAYKNTML